MLHDLIAENLISLPERNSPHMTANPAATMHRQIALRIVERVSAAVQNDIYVTDDATEVVASSAGRPPGIVHDVAARAIADGVLARNETTDGSMLGLPLVYSGHVVGAIILDAVAPHSEELAYMARALAELIIHQMTVIEQLPRQPWAREKFLFDLLQGHLADTADMALQEAALLGIDLTIPRVVVLVAIEPPQNDQANGAQPRSVLLTIERKLRLEQREGAVFDLAREVIGYRETDVASFIGDRWLVIVPTIDSSAVDAQRQQIAHTVQRFLDAFALRIGGTISAGVGRYYAGWQALAQSFADARFALEVGRQIHGAARVYMPSDLGVASFVCSNDPVLKAQLAQHLLHQIADEPELLSTIEVFVDANLSPSLAAQRLHIHRHTLAYRLDKVAQLTGLDPRRFHDLAQLYAALVLRRTCA
jgi:carbohydrate diacid regulator